ncbi:MAG: FGGY-family carbohydrate kinase [Rubrobacteraceae bacterium]
MTGYVIGIDCSTTAAKAVVWDYEGTAVAEGRDTFPLSTPRTDWYEQNAEDWWSATRAALAEAVSRVDPRRIRAVGLTNQRETFVCTDGEGHPVRPAIVWLDGRSSGEVEEFGSREVHEVTGKPPSTTPAFYKLLWLRANEPEVLERTEKVLDVGGFLAHRLTGEWRGSWACADPLGLVDLRSFDWSDGILEQAGIARGQLPDLVAPDEVLGELAEGVAREVGLSPGLPVVGGMGDGQAAGLGANVTRPGLAYLNLGTALVCGAYSEEYSWGQEFRTLSGPFPETYVVETLLRGGTYSISWYVDNFGGVGAADSGLDLSDEEVLEIAARKVPPGSEGLSFLPYLNTASTPYWDAHARGALFGLRGGHGKAHVYRAILEGLAFEQRLGIEGLQKGTKQPVERLLAMGGGSRSPLFCQIFADITGRPVTVCEETETTCLGAAMLAAAAAGEGGSLAEVANAMAGEGPTYEPDDRRSALYNRLYDGVYKELYPKLSDLYPKLSDALAAEG